MDNYDKGPVLGDGTFSKVYSGTQKSVRICLGLSCQGVSCSGKRYLCRPDVASCRGADRPSCGAKESPDGQQRKRGSPMALSVTSGNQPWPRFNP